MKQVKDNFSRQSEGYRKFRPVYPSSLYNLLYDQCTGFETALDCATGNGQVALELSQRFGAVQATDISEQQMAQAPEASNVHYSVQRAEETNFADQSFDLITVGQAYHWFDFKAFGIEAKRLLKPGGIIAIWSYGLLRFNPVIDNLIDQFYKETIGQYWDQERKWVDDEYRTVPFPFREVSGSFRYKIEKEFSLQQLEGYVNTWSAVKHAIAHTGNNPVTPFIEQISNVWKESSYMASFPGFVRLGKKQPR